MNIQFIIDSLELEVVSLGRPEIEISGALAGDLLSFIMASAREKWVWITIQTHLNIAAVAVLKDVPFIILAGGRRPAEDLIERCKEEDLTLASSSLSVYEICGRLYEMGLRAL
ncbi:MULTISPECIES: serine kinase [Aminobacterium]|uniref:serine kinase n=1 Tax=Aminobacterium TaxID=81466 RepID=UPI00257A8D34|nr:serine kinase [Aminobacterium sp. UBA4987]